MPDPAAPAPPPAAAVTAIEREVRRHPIMRTRRGPQRAGSRTAARLTPRGRNARGAPAFDVEAPSEAVRAIAGLGSFGAPFGLVPTLDAARGLRAARKRGRRGVANSFSLARKSLESRYILRTRNAIAKAFQTPSKSFKNASNHFQTLPKVSKSFKNFPGLGDAQGWRADCAMGWGAPVGFVPSLSLPGPLERPELRAARELHA